jgi:prepilin-type N-terminal cleavage/methylation domain-containing protein
MLPQAPIIVPPVKRRLRLRGVSLLEILLVIAIIAILMALMFPTFARAIRKAKSLGHENPRNPDGPRIAPSSVHPREWEDD